MKNLRSFIFFLMAAIGVALGSSEYTLASGRRRRGRRRRGGSSRRRRGGRARSQASGRRKRGRGGRGGVQQGRPQALLSGERILFDEVCSSSQAGLVEEGCLHDHQLRSNIQGMSFYGPIPYAQALDLLGRLGPWKSSEWRETILWAHTKRKSNVVRDHGTRGLVSHPNQGLVLERTISSSGHATRHETSPCRYRAYNVSAWHILTYRQPYRDLRGDYFDQRKKETKASYLTRQLEKLTGVTLLPKCDSLGGYVTAKI